MVRMNEFWRLEKRNADGREYRNNLAMSAYKVKLRIREIKTPPVSGGEG